jgi:hypothetical protein
MTRNAHAAALNSNKNNECSSVHATKPTLKSVSGLKNKLHKVDHNWKSDYTIMNDAKDRGF